jgi:hypothetical protein
MAKPCARPLLQSAVHVTQPAPGMDHPPDIRRRSGGVQSSDVKGSRVAAVRGKHARSHGNNAIQREGRCGRIRAASVLRRHHSLRGGISIIARIPTAPRQRNGAPHASQQKQCSTSYSDLPHRMHKYDLHPSRRSRPALIVCVRSVNQDFFQESRLPLAESVIGELKAADYMTFP